MVNEVDSGSNIERFLMASFGSCTRGLSGASYPNVMACGRPFPIDFAVGSGTGRSNGYWNVSKCGWMNKVASTSTYGVWTPRRFEPVARRAVGEKNRPDGEPADHALGRSRGGFGTKLHLVSDGNG